MIGPKTTMTLQQFTEVADGQGGFIFVYRSVRKIKGVLTPLLGNERMITGKETVFADYMFAIDFPLGIIITEKDRFILKARIFDIVLVENPAQQDIHLEIKLLEVK